MSWAITEVVSAQREARAGLTLTSGVRNVLGPWRCEPWPSKTLAVRNYSNAPLTFATELSLDPSGNELLQGAAGPRLAIDPDPSAWCDQGASNVLAVPASGVAMVVNTTPARWVRLTCNAPLAGLTVSGFALFTALT
jgi:hypothetical protein